jgi:excinuclease ABC subunit B
MPDFGLVSDFAPTGDQPDAIASLVRGVQGGDRYQTLKGVTGSGKTFVMANTFRQSSAPRW